MYLRRAVSAHLERRASKARASGAEVKKTNTAQSNHELTRRDLSRISEDVGVKRQHREQKPTKHNATQNNYEKYMRGFRCAKHPRNVGNTASKFGRLIIGIMLFFRHRLRSDRKNNIMSNYQMTLRFQLRRASWLITKTNQTERKAETRAEDMERRRITKRVFCAKFPVAFFATCAGADFQS